MEVGFESGQDAGSSGQDAGSASWPVVEINGRSVYQRGDRSVNDLSADERAVLAAASGYPLFGIHADSIADDAGLDPARGDELIARLAADGFLVEPPLPDIDADGRRCWHTARIIELDAVGIVEAPPDVPQHDYAGLLPAWVARYFWNHPDPGSLRIPEDSDAVLAWLFGEEKIGLRPQGWAVRNLPVDSLERYAAVADDAAARWLRSAAAKHRRRVA